LCNPSHSDLDTIELLRHQLIVIYKTAYYSFYLPVALAMLFCRIPSPSLLYNSSSSSTAAVLPDEDPYKLAQSILVPLGEYFQVQDDYLDYAGTPEQIGKVGTDIVDNKCSWCINTALTLASPAQRAVLEENYGLKDARAEERVKGVYEEIGLRAKYEEYERAAHERIVGLVKKLPEVPQGQEGLRRDVFMVFLEKIYGRTK
jgi:farnesyl diphosphate synthase